MSILVWVAAVVAWLTIAFASAGTEAGNSSAYNAGVVTGAAVASLVFALLIRLLYVKLLRRRDTLPFWSPWIFVIAAAVGLLAAAGNAS